MIHDETPRAIVLRGVMHEITLSFHDEIRTHETMVGSAEILSDRVRSGNSAIGLLDVEDIAAIHRWATRALEAHREGMAE